MEKLVWDDREYLDGEGLVALRLDKVRRQISYCNETSPFYKRKLAEHDIHAEDIRTWDDFRRIPSLLNKAEEAESRDITRATEGHPFGQMLCAPVSDVVVTSSSSGSSGTPSFYTFTKKDYAQFLDLCARYLWRAGVRAKPCTH